MKTATASPFGAAASTGTICWFAGPSGLGVVNAPRPERTVEIAWPEDTQTCARAPASSSATTGWYQSVIGLEKVTGAAHVPVANGPERSTDTTCRYRAPASAEAHVPATRPS